MKHIIGIIIFLLACSTNGQGLIHFSNGPQILLHGKPVKTGEATVQLATADHQLIGLLAPISWADGQIEEGFQILRGMTGTVRLKLAIRYTAYPGIIVFSDLFSYTLGNLTPADGGPTTPVASIPLREPIDFDPPSFQPAAFYQNVSIKKINPTHPAKFYRARKLNIIETKEDTILLNFEGKLEIAPTPNGPWKLLD